MNQPDANQSPNADRGSELSEGLGPTGPERENACSTR